MNRISDRQITLADGRKLGYAEYGDPSGHPIVYCHGAPGSRLDWPLFGDPAWALRHRTRFIAVDRPGIGLSDFQPGRTIGDWPDDVLQLARQLDLARFAVWGYSGGGPYAAVCAWKIPDHLTNVAIVSGVGPFHELPEAYDLMPSGNRTYWTVTRGNALFSRLFLRFMRFTAKRSPERVSASMIESMPDADKPYISQVDHIIIDAMLEGLAAGPRGAQYDAWLLQQPWAFLLRDIEKPVYLWHGNADLNVPVMMGRYVAEAITHCQSTFCEGEGHISLIKKHRDEIIGCLLASDDS